MNINSVNYDPYLASIAQAQTIGATQTNVQTSTSESEQDSYIPSIASVDMAIPSGTYGADGLERTVGAAYGTATAGEESNGLAAGTIGGAAASTETQESESTDEAEASGGAGGVGGGGSSDSEETTETEVVTINGVTYLQTTTTDESGNTTVTRTPISGASEDE